MKINKSNYIRDTLSEIQSKINNNTKLQLYDINKEAEDIFMHILNLVYGWSLQNGNDEIINFPAIDLIDTSNSNRIAIQVTSTTSKKKVKVDTIEAFEKLVKEEKYKVYADYEIKMFYIKDKPSNTTLKNWEDEGLISQSNILGIEDINKKISADTTHTLATKVFKYLCNKFHDKACDSSTLNPSLTTKTSIHDSSFVGREDEIKAIDTMLDSSNSLLLINGIGGIGKSSLANHYLYTHESQFDHYGFIEGLGSFISEFKNSLELKAEKEEELYFEIISKLQNIKGKKLLVIDNVEDIEEHKKLIEMILSLEKYDYKILFTSRRKIKRVKSYPLGTLLPLDAQKLFLSYYETDELKKVDEVINYLGLHTLFIKLVAETIKNEGYTLDNILEKFEKGELSKIEFTDDESGEDLTFNENLQELFSMQNLKDEHVLLLKRLAILPSLYIELSVLEEIFGKERLKGRLNFLVGRGWLIETEENYKLHQIIKEYILENHRAEFEEIEVVVEFFSGLMGDTTDAQVAANNQSILIYFDAIAKVLKDKNEKVTFFLGDLGNIYHSLGEYKKALFFLRKSLKLKKEVLGESHTNTAISYNNLALLYSSMGEYEKSLLLYEKALKIWKNIFGEFHSNTATSYNNLAILYRRLSEYEKSLLFYQKALKIWKSICGEFHLNTASCYNNLGELYQSRKEYKKALPLYQKSLLIRKDILGDYHHSTFQSYGSLAGLYQGMGKYKKSLSLYKKALNIGKEVLDEFHPSIATNYNNLAIFYYETNNLKESYKYMEKSILIKEKIFSNDDIDLINSKKSLKIIKAKLK